MTELRVALVLLVLIAVSGCAPSTNPSPTPSASDPGETSADTSAVLPPAGSLVIAGRIVTMDQPPVVEAMLIQDGIVAAIGVVGPESRCGLAWRTRVARLLPSAASSVVGALGTGLSSQESRHPE